MNISTYSERYFAKLDAAYQRDMDAIDAYESRKEELCAEYEKEGDLYDAVGSIPEADFLLNYAWKLIKVGAKDEAIRKLEEIMAKAATSYAETKIAEEAKESEEREALARMKRCGRVPAGFDD